MSNITSWADEPDELDALTIKPTLAELNEGVTVNTETHDDDEGTIAKNAGSLPTTVQSFDALNLPEDILKGVYKMGFTKPSKIQETALPAITRNPPQNLIGQAQSGTGKTAAFVLGMLMRCDSNIQQPQAICIAPTRELAKQIKKNVEDMAQFTKFTVLLAVQDEPLPQPVTQQIVVGTPTKIVSYIKAKKMSVDKVKILVLDEADQMLDKNGLLDETVKLRQALPKKQNGHGIQTLFFSATFSDPVRRFAEKLIEKPFVNIKVEREALTVDGIQQFFIDCKTEQHRLQVLKDIYDYSNVGQSIIFAQTRDGVDALTRQMVAAGHKVSALHGAMEGGNQQRDAIFEEFKSGRTKVLVATNVLARGIDVLGVMLVVNYDLPMTREQHPDAEMYLHRIGRSGRFGRKGVSINLVYNDASRRANQYFQDHYKHEIKKFEEKDIPQLQDIIDKLMDEIQKSYMASAATSQPSAQAIAAMTPKPKAAAAAPNNNNNSSSNNNNNNNNSSSGAPKPAAGSSMPTAKSLQAK